MQALHPPQRAHGRRQARLACWVAGSALGAPQSHLSISFALFDQSLDSVTSQSSSDQACPKHAAASPTVSWQPHRSQIAVGVWALLGASESGWAAGGPRSSPPPARSPLRPRQEVIDGPTDGLQALALVRSPNHPMCSNNCSLTPSWPPPFPRAHAVAGGSGSSGPAQAHNQRRRQQWAHLG